MARSSSPQPNVFASGSLFELPFRFWGMVILTGIGAGLAGGALMVLLHAIQHVAWSYHEGVFLDGVTQSSFRRRLLIVVFAGFVVIAGRLLLNLSKSGHGGEVSTVIWFKAGRMPFFSTIGRALLSIVIVALGASLGREGAPKQAGAAIASTLADWTRLTNSERRLLVACGVGAGLAAVYNVPFGGALFALEVLLGTLSLPMVAPALLASLIATGVAWLLIPNQPTYVAPHFVVSAGAFAGAALLGPVAGVAASAWVWLIATADAHKPKGWLTWAAPILVFGILAALSLPYPALLGNGKDVVQLTLLDHAAVPLLLALVVLKPLMTASCLASGAPGGLFTPTMSVGGVLGALFGAAWLHVWPGAPMSLYALLGAGAFLAAASKGPISATVVVLELTRWIDPVMAPLMLAVALATLVARLIDARSIYSAGIHLGREAAEPEDPKLVAGHAARGADKPTVISASAPYAAVLKRLLKNPDAPLYVVDEKGALIGEISAERANIAEEFAAPLEIAAAYDLATPTNAIIDTHDAKNIEQKLHQQNAAQAPVIDAKDGGLVGVAKQTEK
ncbi:MAG TPA: chloride channel protein [Beijerinckiaceae bacterium]|nr:chloride channel protein [Beijerinckiaceae bacterium]